MQRQSDRKLDPTFRIFDLPLLHVLERKSR
jgi:hypothetical protein